MTKKPVSTKEIITIESDDEEESVSMSSSTPQSRSPSTSAKTSLEPKPSTPPNSAKRSLSASSEPSLKKLKRTTPSLQYIEPSIHLTTVERAPSAHNIGCYSLESLIGDPDIELMVQINFMIDVEFVMKRVHESIRDGLRTIVYHGLRVTDQQEKEMNASIRARYPRVEMNRVRVPGIGTHHTKAMLLFYNNQTMQLVLHTANMIPRDWRNKTQALFTTGRLQRKAQTSNGVATSAFERDLLDYLQYYPDHQGITSRVAQYDFRSVKGVLVGSVPGKFSGAAKNKWGHLKLRAALRQQVEIPRETLIGSQIICQISSIGSLGKDSQDWLRGEFEMTLNSCRNSNSLPQNRAKLCVVFPTAENVRTSHEGWSMGGSIPFKKSSYDKQASYLNSLLHSWVATKSGRDRAMPHIKTFTRVTSKPDGDYISWFLLTSSNLSKPAWGAHLKDGMFDIKSYELGVLIFPGLFENLSPDDDSGTGSSGEEGLLHVYMMNATVDNPYPEPSSVQRSHSSSVSKVDEEEEEADADKDGDKLEKRESMHVGVVPVRLPYDLPLREYNFGRDHVWLIDKSFPGLDDFGEECSG